MSNRTGLSSWLGALCIAIVLGTGATAQAATDPLFVFTPKPPPPAPENPQPLVPPPTGRLDGPCGLGVDLAGNFYVSDYYHHAIDVFSPQVNVARPWESYITQIANEDPMGGPCGLALNSSNQLYVNNYHRNVVKFGAQPSFGPGTAFPLPSEETAQHLPTGVAVDVLTGRVYVNHRTYVSVFDSNGNPIVEGGEPLVIGQGTLGDGYGVAVSPFPATPGRVYVPDAASNTVKAYDPTISKVTPMTEFKLPSGQPFTSLRDAVIAVDRVSGDVYLADNLQPNYTERPQATIHVYSATGTYKGHLKYNVVDALPPGLAVDNSFTETQGRVYVTSGSGNNASIYIYGPGSATSAPPLPPLGSGLVAPGSANTLVIGASRGTRGSDVVASASEVVQTENLRVSVTGKLTPKRLPRKGAAPISVSVGWDIATTDGTPPPKLKTLRIEINRHGRFDYEGLSTCPYAKIQPATTQRALANCRSALVGRGSFDATIALRGQEGESYKTGGRLLVFNGEQGGKPVLFGQIYAAHPFATSFVIPFKVSKIDKGPYGTALTAELPPALRSWGDLTGIEMSLSRRYGYEGESHSYVSAGCPAPKGFGLASFKLARTSFSFTGGKELSSTVVGDCRVRG